jgi:aldehyde dehydrogenase (NAD+)
MTQEIFGPILPIQSYKDLEALVCEIRGKPKPLAIYLYSQNNGNIHSVRSQTSSGAFVVNDSVIQLLNCHLPFGGVGESGYGRYHGESGFLAFSNLKSICQSNPYNGYPLSARFFPFTPNKQRAITFLLKIGGTTYSSLAKGSAVIAAAIIAAVGYAKLRPYL